MLLENCYLLRLVVKNKIRGTEGCGGGGRFAGMGARAHIEVEQRRCHEVTNGEGLNLGSAFLGRSRPVPPARGGRRHHWLEIDMVVEKACQPRVKTKGNSEQFETKIF